MPARPAPPRRPPSTGAVLRWAMIGVALVLLVAVARVALDAAVPPPPGEAGGSVRAGETTRPAESPDRAPPPPAPRDGPILNG